MKAQELRIGNYVFSKETQKHQMIVGVTLENPFIDAITFDYTTYNEIEPIPLTEQWLIDFGWGKGEYDTEYQDNVSIDQYILAYNVNAQMFTIESHNDVVEVAHIKSVHQLQNLYFALTGEELQL